MSLIKCSECGAMISSSAPACPSCGKKKPSGCLKAILLVGGGFFVLMIFVSVVSKLIGRGDNYHPAPQAAPVESAAVSQVQPATQTPPAPSPSAESSLPQPVLPVEVVPKTWEYHHQIDPMTSKEAHSATSVSDNTLEFGFPYNGPQHGYLTIRKHPKYGQDVIITIEKGQILCHSYQDCTVAIRFDDDQPQQWSAVGPEDNSNNSFFLRNSAKFVSRLKTAHKVAIQFTVFQEGDQVLLFPIKDFSESEWINVSPVK